MLNYYGSKCIVCENKFSKNDDIVVCPTCGTPYHRNCYNSKGMCINTELHEQNKDWETDGIPIGETIDGDEEIHCSRCGTINPHLSLFCKNCGMSFATVLTANNERTGQNGNATVGNENVNPGSPFNANPYHVNYNAPLCGFNEDEDFDGVKLSEIGDFVGANTHYYIPIFKRMKDTKLKFTWNIAAMLAPSSFYGYRKMYLIMIVSIILKFLISLPVALEVLSTGSIYGIAITNTNFSFDVTAPIFVFFSNLTYILSYAVLFITGALSNWFYYKHVISSIKKIKADGGAIKKEDKPERNDSSVVIEKIKRVGGVSKISMVIVLFMPSILAIISMYFNLFSQATGG